MIDITPVAESPAPPERAEKADAEKAPAEDAEPVERR
jgi:hypothetical protein